jgi:hypothetical protein
MVGVITGNQYIISELGKESYKGVLQSNRTIGKLKNRIEAVGDDRKPVYGLGALDKALAIPGR